jgi:aminoglycoside phosphotransferase (APT) family kinase protein
VTRFDPAALESFLRANVPGFTGPMTSERFSGGRSNPTFRIDTPGDTYVLRGKPAGILQKSAHAIDREFRIMRALAETGFPVPRMLVYCDDESVIGTEFYLMSHVPGEVLWDIAMPGLTSEQRARAFDSVNATIAQFHRLSPAALGLDDFGRGGNYFERQIARWSKQYLALATEQVDDMDRLIAWLTATDLPASEETLVHGDFSFHNVLIDPGTGDVAAVIDWELATIGHPLGDVMYHAMEWYRPPDCDRRGTLLGRDLAALGIPTLEDYLALYCERAGRPPIENLAFHQAYNLFRMAAIAQGIVGRARQGQLPPETAAIYEPRIRPLAQAAWHYAREAGAI